MTSDYIVVGGGTAGCIIAKRLADAGKTVTMLEAGLPGDQDPRVTELNRHAELLQSEYDWDYPTDPQPRDNPLMRYPQAKVLGGGSSHNTSIAFHPCSWDLEEWEACGAAGWGPEGAAKALERVHERVNFEDSAHLGLGPVCAAAGREWGLPSEDFASPDLVDAFGYFKLNKVGDLRESTAAAYLFPLGDLPDNLTVRTEVTVEALIVEDRRVRGVRTSAGEMLAESEVILAAGTFQSPKILMLSGIGPQARLAELGIPLLQDSPNVGKYLTDHPAAVVIWQASKPLPAVQSHWEVGGFHRFDRAKPWPDLEFHFTTAIEDVYLEAIGAEPGKMHGALAMCPSVTKPKSFGEVTLASDDPYADPIIRPNWFSDPDDQDMRILIEGVRAARAIGQQDALSAWIEAELAPGPEVESDLELEEFVLGVSGTSYHPAGTCRMGSGEDAAVGPDLRVRGVAGVRVADASVFPRMVTPNPAVTVMMVGEKCSELILGDQLR